MMCRSAFVLFTRRVSDPVLDVMLGFAAGVAPGSGSTPALAMFGADRIAVKTGRFVYRPRGDGAILSDSL
jgi:hypothetical protein